MSLYYKLTLLKYNSDNKMFAGMQYCAVWKQKLFPKEYIQNKTEEP
jgi:hypothetical protein